MNQLFGSVPPNLANYSRLSYLSFDKNNLMGEIPVEVSQLEQLHELSFFLQQNAFQRTIPSSWGNLTLLQNLDLSNNKLNGSIPGILGGLSNLQTFNVSDNNLQGLILTALATRFNASSFVGNPLLCSTPLTGFTGNLSSSFKWVEYRGNCRYCCGRSRATSLIILPSLCGLCICVRGWRRGTTRATAKAVAETITIAHIHDATCDFAEDHVISRTRFDILFKVTLPVTSLH